MLEGRGARRPTPKRALRIRDVHFALENNGWNCTLECEMHLSTSGSTRRGRRPTPRHPSRGPRRRRLSESVAKAPIAPRRTKRIVDIPRFFSRPIPARGAFATDSDTPPPLDRPRSPARTIMTTPTYEPAAPGEKSPFEQTITAALPLYVFNHP